MTLPTVLVVDDEVRSLEALRRTLEEDFIVFTADGAAAARQVMAAEFVQIVLCDQRMPETSGVEFLRQVRAQSPDTIRIILSGYTETADIIAGINEAGIWQYLLKPWHPEQLLLTLKGAALLWRLQQDNQRLSLELRDSPDQIQARVAAKRVEAKARAGFERITRAADSPMNTLCGQAQKVAPHDLAILVTGESGTGKELLARAIHYASNRAELAFVVENCGALPDQLLEAELFGHKRGAFTGAYEDRIGLFQQADGGTIFLDEIGETSPVFQVKLLRALEEGEIRPVGSPRSVSVDVRVIAATNRDLEADVRGGRFREDLYYRLNVFPIQVPTLRERMEDIPLLAKHFVDLSAKELGCPKLRLTRAGIAKLQGYQWPGNIRELRNVIQRSVILSHGGVLDFDLPAVESSLVPTRQVARATGDAEPEFLTESELQRRERENLLVILQKANWKIKGADGAAELLGVKPTTLVTRMNKMGLRRPV